MSKEWDNNHLLPEWAHIVGWLLFFGVTGFLLFKACDAANTPPPPCEYGISDTRIYSLTLGKELTGSFFLGIGGFGQNEKYYAFEERQGGKLLQMYSADRTVIIESNETPVMRKYINNRFDCPDKLDELRVPLGTVKVQYNVEVNK